MPSPGFDGTTSNRVAIAEGVTLTADEGPAVTVIAGASAPRPYNNDSHGRGVAAVRAVYMAKSSRLIGFTVTEGKSDNSDTGDNLYSSGGGIYVAAADGAEDTVGYVENCTIHGNAGYRGGGAYGGKFVNCRFYNNVSQGAQGEDCRIAYLYGCTFGASFGGRNVMAPKCAVNCTFGPGTCQYGGAVAYKGCLFLSVTAKENVVSSGSSLEDCAYVLGGTLASLVEAGSVTTTRCHTAADAGGFALSPDYVPLKGSVLIDKGPANFDASVFGGLDNRASQRVYNGRIDIGACEYDWRSDYARRLGCTGAEVAYASPEVVDSGTYLSVPDGSSLDVAWTQTDAGKVRLVAEVEGEGVFSVAQDGAVRFENTAADGRIQERVALDGPSLFSFAFHGGGAAKMYEFSRTGALVIILK
jgi:hypothetical protein